MIIDKQKKAVILIVDDTSTNLSMLFELLVYEKYTVLIAEDGESALEQTKKRQPDLILLDILMPKMDGFATCKALKKNPLTQNIPVIFMSAMTETEKKLNGFKLGAIDYINKPFQNEEVIARVRTHLHNQQLKQQLLESRQRLSQIIANSKDAIVTLDKENNILLFNYAAEHIFKCQSKNAIGHSFQSFLSDPLWQFIKKHFQLTKPTHTAIWIPEGHHALRRNGDAFPIEGTISTAQSGEHILNTIILRDIDERLKTQAEAQQLRQINHYFQQRIQVAKGPQGLVGESIKLLEVMSNIQQVATTDATVLILGETGTGKELVVQAIHQQSQRKDQPLIKLNCAAIPNNLVESELFGHEKGAFTGALSKKIGRFELADSGTLFLDEIGEMPMDVQTKLLRILQEGEFERVGGSHTIKVNVRIIAATHRDLPQCINKGLFREDLFYRLNVFPINIPALRDRAEDIEALAYHFLKIYAAKFNKQVNTIPSAVISILEAYHWPGNVRELQHLIERAVILSVGNILAIGEWFQPLMINSDMSPIITLEEVEYQHILKILEKTNWRISGHEGAADLLGINPSTLRSRMNKLGLKRG